MELECRWGGPATPACWNPGACGCNPTCVEEVWREAHAAHAERLVRVIGERVFEVLRLDRLVAWLGGAGRV